MGKLIALIAVGLVAAGGGAYGLYAYTDTFQSHSDLGSCDVSNTGGCCGGPSQCTEGGDAEMQAAVALAGPAGVVQATAPVAAVAMPCCSSKAAAK